MKRKISKSFSVVILLILTIIIVGACSSSESTPNSYECEHKFSQWKQIKAPTCTENGKMSRRCSECGERETKPVDKAEHTIVIIPGEPATCFMEGRSDAEKCSVCQKIIKHHKSTPRAQHEIISVEAKAPTCTLEGHSEYNVCSVCGEFITPMHMIPKLSHTEKTIPGVASTCLINGITDSTECIDCGNTIVAATQAPLGEHIYENGFCTVCGETENVSKGFYYYYSEIENGMYITDLGICRDEHIIIPRVHEGYLVIGIEADVFKGNERIKSVVLPDTIKYIEPRAFEWCVNLKSIRLSESLIGIGQDAFSYCYSLEEIFVPESVEFVSSYAFSFCKSLKAVTLGSNRVGSYLLVEHSAFYKCEALENVTMKSNVYEIAESLFEGCKSLKTVELNRRIREIHNYAFKDCTELGVIRYEGSAVDWNNVIKYEGWYLNTKLEYVTCNDQNVSLKS